MKSKVGLISLGCPRNLVDSESILGRLNLKGYPVVDIENADIGIVNTCAFIKDAKAESVEAILALAALKRRGKLKKLIVYGCLAQRYKKKLIRVLPEVDAFIGSVGLDYNCNRFSLTPSHYAYLKICEGCINNCSYCIIPKIKGKFTSVNLETLLCRAMALDKEGISELNIIGQDISGYGRDLYGKFSLTKLLKVILAGTKHIRWLRLLYLHPQRVSDELLGLIGASQRICKYLDLPLQHVNSRILKLMSRNGRKDIMLRLIEKIRKRIPDAAIRTSFIVGFPSETDKEFAELLKFIEEARFERMGAFIYSREEGTRAYNFKKQIPPKVKEERFNLLMLKQQEVSRSINNKYLGATIDVLIDEKENDYYLGRSQHDAPEVDGLVYVNSKRELEPGDLVKLKVTDTLEYDLVGEVI